MTAVVGVVRDRGHDDQSASVVRAREQLPRVRGRVGNGVDDSVGAAAQHAREHGVTTVPSPAPASRSIDQSPDRG